MPEPASPETTETTRTDGADAASSKAAFLGGLLSVASLVALSVVGVGHARTIAGAANAQYWIVVAGVAAALGFIAFSLARTPARTGRGEIVRKIALPLAGLWLAIFLWEAVAVGSGAFAGPFELGWAAWKS